MSCKICKFKETGNFQLTYVTLNKNKRPSKICGTCINNDEIVRCFSCNLFCLKNKKLSNKNCKNHKYKPYNYYIYKQQYKQEEEEEKEEEVIEFKPKNRRRRKK